MMECGKAKHVAETQLIYVSVICRVFGWCNLRFVEESVWLRRLNRSLVAKILLERSVVPEGSVAS